MSSKQHIARNFNALQIEYIKLDSHAFILIRYYTFCRVQSGSAFVILYVGLTKGRLQETCRRLSNISSLGAPFKPSFSTVVIPVFAGWWLPCADWRVLCAVCSVHQRAVECDDVSGILVGFAMWPQCIWLSRNCTLLLQVITAKVCSLSHQPVVDGCFLGCSVTYISLKPICAVYTGEQCAVYTSVQWNVMLF